MGYHLRTDIVKGIIGQPSKILEEYQELEDAINQKNKILIHCELADLYGALEAVAENYDLSMSDLKTMSDATRSAFKDGTRS